MPEEYIIPLTIDVAGIIQKSSSVKTSLSDVGDAAKKAGTDAKDSFDKAGKGAQDMSNKVVDSSQKVTLLTKNIEQLQIQLASYERVAKTSLNPQIITEYNKKAEALKNQISQLSNSGKEGFDKLGNAIAKSTNLLSDGFSVIRKIAYILPGIGIAGILAFFTGPLIEYISSLNKLNEALNTTRLSQSFVDKAVNSDEFKKANSSIFELTENIKLAKEGFLDKTKVLAEYNKELGASLGYTDSLNGAEALLIEKGQAFIQITLLKASAQLALADASKKQLEIAKIQLSNTDVEDANNDNKNTSGFANLTFFERLKSAFEQSDKATNDLLTKGKDRALKTANDEKAGLLAVFDSLQKQAAELAKKNRIDFFDGTQDPKKTKDNAAALLAARKALLDQLVKLQNDYNAAQIAAIDDAETKEVAQNDVNYQNKVRTLKQQQQDLIAQAKANKFPELASLIQDNIREISVLIAKTEEEGQAADLTIIAKYAALKLKAQQDSLRAIGVLLKDETDARIEAIRANYAKVTAEAKKNGVLTDDLQKKLIKQQEADISDVQSKAIDKRLVEVQELEEAGINASSKKKGQTQKDFDEQLQRELLAIDIKGTQQRIGALAAVLATQGGLTPDQTKLLGQLTTKLNKDLGQDESNKEADKLNIFRQLGIDQDTQTKVQQYGAAASQIGKITADLFSGLADAANQQVDAIQKQIDALSALLQADQDAVDKQQALSDKGRANALDAAKKKLADDQKLKDGLQKQEEAAAKKRDQLQKAQIIADSISQVSNLITAATEIYKSVSVIPVIGPALAFATVAAMFAGFAVAKVTALNAVNAQSAEEGGVAGGDRHSTGGNKYVSMDGKDPHILEIEKGERIFSRKNSEKHSRLFEAIQNNDYSKLDIGDVSIQELLRGTGVMSQLEVARRTGNQNITLQDRANNVVVIGNNSDKYLSSIDKKMDNLNRREPVIIDFGDYIWIDHGNGHTERRYK